jgi:hypothetical protein
MTESITTLRPTKLRTLWTHAGEKNWGIYNSPLESYQNTFSKVLDGEKIVEILSSVVHPVVVDFLASTGTLADLFSRIPGIGKLGVAVSLTDKRDNKQIERDELLGIKVVTGDLNKSRTWRETKKALGGRKVDLILERGEGGLFQISDEPLVMAVFLKRMWDMLSENGTMLLQIDYSIPLTEKFVNTLEDQGVQVRASGGVLFIRRSVLSPDHLVLPPLSVLYTPVRSEDYALRNSVDPLAQILTPENNWRKGKVIEENYFPDINGRKKLDNFLSKDTKYNSRYIGKEEFVDRKNY